MGPRNSISNKLPGDVDATGPETSQKSYDLGDLLEEVPRLSQNMQTCGNLGDACLLHNLPSPPENGSQFHGAGHDPGFSLPASSNPQP